MYLASGAPSGLIHAVTDQPLLLLFAVIAIGAAVGSIKVRGVSLGPAAALFTGLALSAWDSRLQIPAIIGTLGLVLFTYTVGVASGPAFFSGLRRGARAIVVVVLAVAVCAALAVPLGAVLGLPRAGSLGAFAGALTNTPALAAVTEHSHSAQPTVGYSIAYLGGVLVFLVAAAYASREQHLREGAPIVTRTAHVTTEAMPTAADVAMAASGPVRLTRLAPAGGVTPTVVHDDNVLAPGDLVTIVGERPAVDSVVDALGYQSKVLLHFDRTDLDFRRITISDRSLAGQRIGELHLAERFEAQASRLRHGDQDMVALDDMVISPGDRIRIIAPRGRMKEIARFFGDSERGASDINPVGLALGITLGLLIGWFTFSLGGGVTLSLGAPAGSLLVGLLAGRLGRTGPITWVLPGSVSNAFGQFGVLTFLGYAGSRSGHGMVTALSSPAGLKYFGLGLVLTLLFCAIVVLGSRAAGVRGAKLAGLVGGAQTQPAVLAFAQDRNDGSPDVNTGYVLVYPAAMIAKILLVTVLAAVLL